MPRQNHRLQKFEIQVKTIKALPGGKFEEAGSFNCGKEEDARAAADRLQREFDADSDPCRTYVYKGEDPIPVYAGLCSFFYDKKKDYNRQGRKRLE